MKGHQCQMWLLVFSLILSLTSKTSFQTDRAMLWPVECSKIASDFRQLQGVLQTVNLPVTAWKGEHCVILVSY